ncbi:MAG: DUF2202 domain-containing protein [Planctomycetales bacterium]|nr:DUF2202 domain-containing protein [Planctomycetales bacterium]
MTSLQSSLVALLLATFITSDVNAQSGRSGSGGQHGRSPGSQVRSRSGWQVHPGKSQRENGIAASQLGNQFQQAGGRSTATTDGPGLLRLWEEEKLARDVYKVLAMTSQLGIFQNISQAESQHMRAVERLIQSNGGNTGNLNSSPGMFVFAEHHQLYESLVASGSQSPLDALTVGARIEEMDIADLQQLLAQTTDPQVHQILERLMHASQNHLRAFSAQIEGYGASFRAGVLAEAEFDQISNAAGHGRGQAVGRGSHEVSLSDRTSGRRRNR